MSREKQIIEEMANDLAQHCPDLVENCCGASSCVSCIVRFLHNAGYRKQEWISVDERLPEAYEDVLYFNGQSVGVDFICSDGTWCDEVVHGKPITHWMPLPEAPKMKGGEHG